MRLFVSIDLPETLTEAVADAQARLSDADGLRFTDPEQAHLTLKFLGDTDSERVPEIEDAMESAVAEAGVGPFDATVGGFGVFPSLDYISVVWTGIRDGAGAAETTRLHEAVERETVELGFEEESHEFTPHVTVARMDDARGKDLVQRVVEEEDPELGTFRVEDIRLKESTLTDEGPRYDTVTRVEL
ncbi:RNA 2',3'-cyclic phosphodiesterase [Halopelagius longus]|uniref:RNA 2',3'-cyclic phosphodiesterase n=1 Tax=Halopelagius longus TaxID=1236180 RepID=A0A1H1EGK6_9EURY|nr:RNA 2',3'-cyclic phosphodiesterase [Halopelagius longus]RDI71749.1 RNA 2',3'-cyclic phosphodiesterase [Halopelagius longus]SDQ87872.1 2'-5' RNA ligase [Halopelagius longus]